MDLQLNTKQCTITAALVVLFGKGTQAMNPSGFLESPCPSCSPLPHVGHLSPPLASLFSNLVLLGLAQPGSSSVGQEVGGWLLKPPLAHPKLLLPSSPTPPQLTGFGGEDPMPTCWRVMEGVVPWPWGICGVLQYL